MTADNDQSQTDGFGETPAGDGTPEYGTPREGEVSLLDILLVLARNKTLIVRTVLVFTLLGVTYALLAPEEYTSNAKVVREAQEGAPGGLPGGLAGGALSGLGISLGGAGAGLSPQAFPDVLQSREVKMGVVRDTFSFPDAKKPMTFLEYTSQPPTTFELILKYSVKLPWTLKRALGEQLSGTSMTAGEQIDNLTVPTEEEAEALKLIGEMVGATLNEETGLMTISSTAGGPVLAANLVRSYLTHLRTRVREIRTEKVRKRLAFVKQRFQESERELSRAEERLARFLERNQNPTTASLQFQQDRLRRQVRFKEQLYSDLQGQLTQARLDLQRRQPVVTVVEEAVPPLDRSAPKRTLVVIISVFFGIAFGILAVFLREFFAGSEEQEKVEELKERLSLDAIWKTVAPHSMSSQDKAEEVA